MPKQSLGKVFAGLGQWFLIDGTSLLPWGTENLVMTGMCSHIGGNRTVGNVIGNCLRNLELFLL